MKIDEWFAAGKPVTTVVKRGASGSPFAAATKGPPGGCRCDSVRELKFSIPQQLQWYNLCPACRRQSDRVRRLPYSEKLGAFVGTGVDAPDAQVIQPTPSPTLFQGPTPSSAPAPANVQPEKLTMTGRTGLGSLVGAGVGSVIPGVGTTIGGVLGGVLGSLGGKSKCPGPYNYNPRTGGCDPKPNTGGTQGLGLGLTSGGPCPAGFEWDGMQCKKGGLEGFVERTLPGGETGYGSDVYGQAVMGAFGKPALQPYVDSQPVQRCPPGLVLGKDNLCYARSSIRNSDRKWPKAPRPALSAQDMKTIRKAASLQNKVKRAAMKSGFTCKKR